MSVNISRVTTPSSAAVQANELSTVANQDMDDTLLTVGVQTVAGYQLVSGQALDRGAHVEETMLQDLTRQLYTSLDSTLLNQSTHGLTNVAHAIDDETALVSANADSMVLYADIIKAASQSATAVRGVGYPDLVVMHPRRWYFLQSALVSQYPLIGNPAQAGPMSSGSAPTGVTGRLPCGLNVVADANVTTSAKGGAGGSANQDEIYVGPSSEAHLWEDSGSPVLIRAEQPMSNQLGVQLVMFEYMAYTYERYSNGFQKVSGVITGAPTGY